MAREGHWRNSLEQMQLNCRRPTMPTLIFNVDLEHYPVSVRRFRGEHSRRSIEAGSRQEQSFIIQDD
jgi:hypothetical protein